VLRIIASQYLAALILGFANSATIQPVIAVERPVFYREKAAGAHSVTLPALQDEACRPVVSSVHAAGSLLISPGLRGASLGGM